ncbi:MAG TPA: hypothetical protein K8V56_19785 [Sporosarcina psychrophila]|uniref:Uncharacterized protein n=1 Tax=Sporosarcina psychrophila TaxID=1476 RepID=A0A921G364_SPOPS|nr:hypothetical protein [Sporosarcina psychrophila]
MNSKEVSIIVNSKSGTTIESALREMAMQSDFTSFIVPNNIGGRSSVLMPVTKKYPLFIINFVISLTGFLGLLRERKSGKTIRENRW